MLCTLNSALFQEGEAIGVGGGGGGVKGLFVKSFLPAFREKQHRNIFSHNTAFQTLEGC